MYVYISVPIKFKINHKFTHQSFEVDQCDLIKTRISLVLNLMINNWSQVIFWHQKSKQIRNLHQNKFTKDFGIHLQMILTLLKLERTSNSSCNILYISVNVVHLKLGLMYQMYYHILPHKYWTNRQTDIKWPPFSITKLSTYYWSYGCMGSTST